MIASIHVFFIVRIILLSHDWGLFTHLSLIQFNLEFLNWFIFLDCFWWTFSCFTFFIHISSWCVLSTLICKRLLYRAPWKYIPTLSFTQSLLLLLRLSLRLLFSCREELLMLKCRDIAMHSNRIASINNMHIVAVDNWSHLYINLSWIK